MRKCIAAIFVEYQRDDLMVLSAAFVYFALLSIMPVGLLTIGILGWMLTSVPAAQTVLAERYSVAAEILGPRGTEALRLTVDSAQENSMLSIVLGTLFTLFGASLVFNFLRTGFRRIYQGPLAAMSPADAAKALVQQTGTDRIFGFIVVLAIVVSFIVSMVVLTLAHLALNWFGWLSGGGGLSWIAELGLSLLLSALTIALLFKFVPPVKVAWAHVWAPAATCAALFAALRMGFTIYLDYVGTRSTSGALGTVLALAIYLFSMGLIFFVCTEMVKLNWKSGQRSAAGVERGSGIGSAAA